MDKEYENILRRFDKKDEYECPANFDYDTLRTKVLSVAEKLRGAHDVSVRIDHGVQDASFGFDIWLPDFTRKAEDQNAHMTPYVRFSNFGQLVTIGFMELLDSNVSLQILQILDEFGFTYVPFEVLDVPYDGVMAEVAPGKPPLFPTWWTKYFDYL